MSKYDIYGIGNAIVDYEIEVEDEFLRDNQIEKGLMTLVDEKRQKELLKLVRKKIKKRQGGGSAANSVIALSQLGGQAFLSCKVANDEDGHFYLSELDAVGIRTNVANPPKGITGKCLVMVSPDTQRTMNTYLGITADLSVNELVPEALQASKYIYIEGYLVSSAAGPETINEARQLARKAGVKVAYSFSDPAMVKYFRAQSKAAVGEGVDCLFANEEEGMLFSGKDSPEEAYEAMKPFAETLVFTRSEKGAWIHHGGEDYHIQPQKVTAVDANGAGDMFAGAFLYGLTNGWHVATAGALASKASAAVVTQFGPRLPLATIRNFL